MSDEALEKLDALIAHAEALLMEGGVESISVDDPEIADHPITLLCLVQLAHEVRAMALR
jgi:hypothetical protein